MPNRFRIVALFAVACALPARAGNLNPPGGAVSSTMKTLDQVESRTPISSTTSPGDGDSVYRISSSGSYYLTGNVSVGNGRAGIEIAASNVTLDLNGFAIIESILASALDGVTVTGNQVSVTVRNGAVRSVNGDGVDMANIRGGFIEGISVRNVGGVGIRTGAGARVINCDTSVCNGAGFVTSSNVTLQSCTAELNGAIGFQLSFSCVARDCTANANSQSGFTRGVGSTLENCTSLSNSTAGFSLAAGARASNCAAYLNGASGFSVGDGGLVESCVARGNVQYGVTLSDNATVTDTSVFSNGSAGIVAASDCAILDNTCRDNVGHGVLLNGSRNHVARNSISGHAIGVQYVGCRNIVIANVLTANPTQLLATGSCDIFVGFNFIGTLSNLFSGTYQPTDNLEH